MTSLLFLLFYLILIDSIIIINCSAHVTAVFEIEGKGKEFTRGIHNSSNVYKINKQVYINKKDFLFM